MKGGKILDIILAVDKNWGIGKEGKLLADLPMDLTRFKNLTVGQIVVMGRKTYESLPIKPLPDRYNVVITSHPEDLEEGVFAYPSIDSFLIDINKFMWDNFVKGWMPNIYVIGGANLVEQLLPYCHSAYITKIDEDFEADVFIPNLEELGWKEQLSTEMLEENGYKYQFKLYQK